MLEFIAAVLTAMGMVPGILLRFVPFQDVMTKPQRRKLLVLYTLAWVLNFVGLFWNLRCHGMYMMANYLRYSSLLYAVVLSILNMLVIRGRVREHLFITGIVLNFRYLLMTIPNFVIALMPGLHEDMMLFVVVAVYTLLLVLTYWPLLALLRYTVTPFLQQDMDEYWSAMYLIPLAFFGARYITIGGEHNVGGVAQLFGSAMSVFCILLVCISLAREHRVFADRQSMEKQLAAQKLHYAALQGSVENARRSDHDMKHRMVAIRRFIDTDDKEGLRAFCDEIDARTSLKTPIPYTGNAAADGVLYHYINEAAQQGIAFSYSGAIHSEGIADLDLCVLLGNALDNAMAGCATVPGRGSILVVSKSEGHLLSVMVRNTFDGKLEKRGDVLLSRKRKNSPGVGIGSMEEICRRCGGSLKLDWDDECFTLMFILPVNPLPEET